MPERLTSTKNIYYKCVLRDVIEHTHQHKMLVSDDDMMIHGIYIYIFHAHYTAHEIPFVRLYCNCACFMCELVVLSSEIVFIALHVTENKFNPFSYV